MFNSKLQTLAPLFSDRSTRFPDRPFLTVLRDDRLDRITYSEAAARVAGLAQWFAQHGYGRGDRVICWLDERETTLWFVLAASALGMVPVPLSEMYIPESVKDVGRRLKARAVLTLSERAEEARQTGLDVLVLPGDGDRVPDGTVAVRHLAVADAAQRLRAESEALKISDMFLIAATAGSSGPPKLVQLPYASHFIGAKILLDTWTAEREGDNLGILLSGALTHGSGMFALFLAVHLGAELCMPRGLDVGVDLADAEQLNPSVLIVVPRVLRSLVKQHRERYDDADDTPLCGSRLRRIYTGGAVIDESLIQVFERRGIEVCEIYGSTEAGIVSFGRPGRRRPGFVGEIVPSATVKISEDSEVLARAPTRALGLEASDGSPSPYDDEGFCHTADLGAVEGTYLRILGRKRDVLHTQEGSYVYPSYIEERLENLDWVEQALLIGDTKPFIVALIHTRAAGAKGTPPLGYIAEQDATELYAKARADLNRINSRLDRFAQIQRFALFGLPMPETVYGRAGSSKVARNRDSATELYHVYLEALYSPRPHHQPQPSSDLASSSAS